MHKMHQCAVRRRHGVDQRAEENGNDAGKL